MKFCLDDGSLLVDEPAPTRLGPGGEATLQLPVPRPTQPAYGPASSPQPTMTSVGFQPAGSALPGPQIPAERSGHASRGLLWIVVALIIGGSGIAIALIVMRGPDSASVSQPTPSNPTPTPTSSASIESKLPANVTNTKVNQETERPTPLTRPTPAKVDVKVEQPSPPVPRAPISGGVLNGKATYLAKPAYPPAAKAVNASGAVNVQVLVNEEGNVISASAVSGHPLLRQAAVAAARASKFSPTKLSGQPVKVSGVIVYNFQPQ